MTVCIFNLKQKQTKKDEEVVKVEEKEERNSKKIMCRQLATLEAGSLLLVKIIVFLASE